MDMFSLPFRERSLCRDAWFEVRSRRCNKIGPASASSNVVHYPIAAPLATAPKAPAGAAVTSPRVAFPGSRGGFVTLRVFERGQKNGGFGRFRAFRPQSTRLPVAFALNGGIVKTRSRG
jgi:hypothetical protein